MNQVLSKSLPFKQSILSCPVYKGGKAIETIREQYGLERIIKLASNENPLPTSPVVVEALQGAIAELNRYPVNSDEPLRNALTAYIGRGVTPDMFISGNGGCDVLLLIARGFLEAGDEAIICPPTFPMYELTIKQVGATAVYAPRNDDFTYNIENVLTAVTDKTRLIYLCSPNNPTGNVLTQSQLDQLLSALPDNIVVVADEVYWQFNTDKQMADSLAAVLAEKNLIILHSFSKVFGLAGMRLGYGIARPEIIDYLTRTRLPFHINQMTMVAALAALQDHDHIQQTIELTVTGRERLRERLQAMAGVTVWPTQANFLLMQTEMDSKQVARRMMEQGVIIRELSGFYMPGYLRVSVGMPEENDLFVELLKKIIGHG